MGVLHPVGLNYFNGAIVSFDRKTKLKYRIALTDLVKQPAVPFGELGGFVKTFLYGSKKTVVFVRHNSRFKH
jgi:hypothetical protein